MKVKLIGMVLVVLTICSGYQAKASTFAVSFENLQSDTEEVFITPDGYGALKLGMSKEQIPSQVSGLYDKYEFEADEMGEFGDFYSFTLDGKVVAEAYMDASNSIYHIRILRENAQTEDHKFRIGMSMKEALANAKFKLLVQEGPLLIVADNLPYMLGCTNYYDDFMPEYVSKIDVLFDSRGELSLTPDMVNSGARLQSIELISQSE